MNRTYHLMIRLAFLFAMIFPMGIAWAQEYQINIESDPAICKALSEEANTLIRNGDYVNGETKCFEILDQFPDSIYAPDAKINLAWIKYYSKAPKAEIIAAFLETAKMYPNTSEAADALYRIALVRLEGILSGDGIDAIDAAQKAFDTAITHPYTTKDHAASCMREAAFLSIMRYNKSHKKEDILQAIKRFENCAAYFKDNPKIRYDALNGEARCYQMLGNYDDAIKIYEKIARKSLDAPDISREQALYGIGIMYTWKQDHENAQKILQEFLDSAPGKTLEEKDTAWRKDYPTEYGDEGLGMIRNAALQLGICKYATGDSITAYQELGAVVKAFPKDVEITRQAIGYRDYLKSHFQIPDMGDGSN